MFAVWKLKKFMGLKFDLIDAYGQVLERHSQNCEPIELLPAPKEELKQAILNEAQLAALQKNAAYVDALMASFLSLANFQSGLPRGGLKVYEKMLAASKMSGEKAADAVLELTPTLGAAKAVSELASMERRKLASEWQVAFENLAAGLQKHFVMNHQRLA